MICEWFLLCTQPAHTRRSHPVLGDVPICLRCAAKLPARSNLPIAIELCAEYGRFRKVKGCRDSHDNRLLFLRKREIRFLPG